MILTFYLLEKKINMSLEHFPAFFYCCSGIFTWSKFPLNLND